MSDFPADRLSGCMECATPQPLDNGKCEKSGCDGDVVLLDFDFPGPMDEQMMGMLRDLSHRLSKGRIQDPPGVVRKIAAAYLHDRDVTLSHDEAGELINHLGRCVEIPKEGEDVRWWADVASEAQKLADRTPHPREVEDGSN